MPQSVLNKEISAFLKILENCINLYYVANVCAILLAWLVYKIFVLIPTRLKTAIFENTKFPIHPITGSLVLIQTKVLYHSESSELKLWECQECSIKKFERWKLRVLDKLATWQTLALHELLTKTVATTWFQPTTNQFHPGTIWFQPRNGINGWWKCKSTKSGIWHCNISV